MLKVVITGGPCTGKTSVVENLKELGYHTLPEAARKVIEEQEKIGSDALPWKDKLKFQNLVLKKQIEQERGIPENAEIVFLDRGIPDGIAYLRVAGLPVPEEYYSAAEEHRYDFVFLLEELPFFENDSARRESPEERKIIQREINRVYEELGYGVAEVPFMSVEERINYILRTLGSFYDRAAEIL